MIVKKKTPRTELAHKTILLRLGDVFNEVVEELSAPRYLVDEAMSDFALISARMDFAKDEVDFEPILPSDGAEAARKKWAKYLDTDCMPQIEAALRMIRDADRPFDATTAPTPPEGAEPK